ncbi:MAG: hypothetical protein GY818_18925 [Planctomycetaceae bacterium]|nr:hypothetical protein [Planctomycetaceae bacterium]
MSNINFKHDLKALEKDLGTVAKKILPKAIPQAVNRTLNSTAGAVTKFIAGETGLKNKTIKSKLIKSKASKSRFNASIDAEQGKAQNLITSVTKSQRKPGVFNRRLKNGRFKSAGVKARAWKVARVYKRSFIVNTSKGVLVATRTSDKRKPLKFLKGPSIRKEFDSSEGQKVLKANTDKRLPIEISAAVNNQLKRINRR